MDYSATQTGDSFFDRLTDSLDDAGKHRLAVMRRVNGKYFTTPRDKELARQLQFLIEGHATRSENRRPEGRGLVVIGEARVGKTWGIDRAIRQHAVFEPDGDFLPLVSMIASSPCGLKQLGRELLKVLGYPLQRELSGPRIWELVRDKLEERRTRFVWIDEMHHAMRSVELQDLRDTIKNTMQQKKWPVSFILSGIPTLTDFLVGDMQFTMRKRVVHFGLLDFASDATRIAGLVQEIVETHAGMQLAADATDDEFVGRLCHAACQRFGLLIVLTRNAVEQALDSPSANIVTAIHFAMAYQALTGCSDHDNVFTAENWKIIRPENALLPEPDEEPPVAPVKKSRGRKKEV